MDHLRYTADQKEAKIRSLLEQGYSRSKIVELTGIPTATVGRYTHNIHEQDKIKWDQEANESLESRAITIKKHYENIAKKAEERVNDPNISTKDLEIASKLLIACHNNIYNMLKFGPLRFPTPNIKEIEDKNEQ